MSTHATTFRLRLKDPMLSSAAVPCHKDTFQNPGALALILLLLTPLSLLGADQPIQIVALTNSADFQPGLPQKGSLASIFCKGLQGVPGIVTAQPQYPLPTEIVTGGFSIAVAINFTPAPILAIAFEQGYQQINVQVPWEAPGQPLFVQVFQGSNSAYLVDPNPWVDWPFGNPATSGGACFSSMHKTMRSSSMHRIIPR